MEEGVAVAVGNVEMVGRAGDAEAALARIRHDAQDAAAENLTEMLGDQTAADDGHPNLAHRLTVSVTSPHLCPSYP